MTPALSILELGRVKMDATRRDALEEALKLAQHAESLGIKRFWVAEHHNMPAVTTAACSVVIGYIASGTKTIRVGAGGIMLPNHAPLVIAEQFGTLETLYPGRIDLGLGRAPGTDRVTMRALRRQPSSAETFPQDVLELQAYLAPLQEGQVIEAVPGSGTEIPLWILGSSDFGAQLAAQLSLPYGFASHFAPQALDLALSLYHQNFKPSKQLQKPYTLIGVNVIAADTDEEARRLATSQQMSFADFLRNQRLPLRPPIDDIESHWNEREKQFVEQMLEVSIVGGPEKVQRELQALWERTRADEFMVVTDVFDFDKRARSFDILAEAVSQLKV